MCGARTFLHWQRKCGREPERLTRTATARLAVGTSCWRGENRARDAMDAQGVAITNHAWWPETRESSAAGGRAPRPAHRTRLLACKSVRHFASIGRLAGGRLADRLGHLLAAVVLVVQLFEQIDMVNHKGSKVSCHVL